jgi:hypothetical protein
MIFDKSGMWDAVRIGKHKVGAFRSSQGLVEDCILTKPPVFVPEVMDWAGQGWGEANDQIASGGGGPIIGNENLHRSSCLVAKTSEAQLQRANVIVGTDDEGNLI